MSTTPSIVGSSAQQNAVASSAATTAASTSAGMANEQTFLQLLIAQIKNQDPSQPTDGSQFLTQLATFSQLEQLIGIRQDLDTVTNQNTSTTTQQVGN